MAATIIVGAAQYAFGTSMFEAVNIFHSDKYFRHINLFIYFKLTYPE